MNTHSFCLLIAANMAAGVINSIAGGGSFLTFPALLMCGLDPRAANITSTVALFPMQLSTGYAGRALAAGTPTLPFKVLFAISLTGGLIGAIFLLLTPPVYFARLVPWLILFATAVFAYGCFFRKPLVTTAAQPTRVYLTTMIQFIISIYGGYFGGGVGFLMLAALTLAGMTVRAAGATKNILAGAMNASAVFIFLFSHDIGWPQAAVGIAASMIGGTVGVHILGRVNEKILRMAVVGIGLLLTCAMFLYRPK